LFHGYSRTVKFYFKQEPAFKGRIQVPDKVGGDTPGDVGKEKTCENSKLFKRHILAL